MADYRQFTDAILKGAQVAAPNSWIPEVGNAMTNAYRAEAVRIPGAAQGRAAQIQADDEEKRRRAAQEAKLRELQDQADPSKYQKVRKKDGGFDFFDPTGKPIDVSTYAKVTGQKRAEILADSDNPLDRQFVDDYKQANELSQAIWRNDTTVLKDAKERFPDLLSGAMTPDEINKRLLRKYPHIFGIGKYEQSRSSYNNPLFRVSDRYVGPTGAGGGDDNEIVSGGLR